MRLFAENRKTLYEVVPCGKDCGYSRRDGEDPTLEGFSASHCTKTCYCPKWFLDVSIDCAHRPAGAFFGLRRLGPVENKTRKGERYDKTRQKAPSRHKNKGRDKDKGEGKGKK